MARFGLVDSDSDSDVQSDSTARRSRSTSARPSEADGDASFASSSHLSQDDDDDDYDDEEAPPRSSLMQDDDDHYSGSDIEGSDDDLDQDEDDEDDEEISMADDTFVRQSKSRRSTRRNTRSQSARSDRDRSYSLQPDSPPPSTRRKALLPPSSAAHSAHKNQQNQPWAAKLKLEPKRVAVMQASFFRQADSPDVLSEREREKEREAQEEERERKRRAVEAGFAGRAAPAPAPVAAAPAPVPTPILDPAPFRSFRHYSRVPLASSTLNSKEGSLVDAGLALGRSYRVGWGKRGEVVSLKGVYEAKEGRSDVVTVEKVQLLSNDDPASALRLLKLQLSQTEIFPPTSSSPSSAPAASPSPSLRFSHFVDLFPPSSSTSSSPPSSSSPSSTSPEAQLFRLGRVLFDEIPTLFPPSSLPTLTEDERSPSYSSRVLALRRRAQLSQWLEEAAAPSVASDISSLPAPSSTSSTSSAAKRIFAFLSGHQLAQACDAAVSSGNLRLATLLAQAGSPGLTSDEGVANDVFLQLSKWAEYGADSSAVFSTELRRVWEVLSGNLGVSEGKEGKGGQEERKEELHVLEGLGWVRAVGMGLWYGPSSSPGGGDDAGVAAAVERYEAAVKADKRVTSPSPSYGEEDRTWAPSTTDTPQDPTFHLLKLFTSPTHSLESALLPRNFGSSPTDYRLPWHLYLLLSRVLRRRDFEDRVEVEQDDEGMAEEGEKVEGNSVTADRVTVSYAEQLERLGLWEWSAFVLLHLELDAHRTTALRALLACHVDELDPSPEDKAGQEKVHFLIETLKIPAVWLYSAQADLSLSLPSQRFKSYTLLLSSLRRSEAHRIAVEELVPEAIVRGDAGLVRRLLEPFVVDEEEAEDGSAEGEEGMRGSVEGWEEGGKVYLLYLSALSSSTQSLSSLTTTSSSLSHAISAVQAFSQRAATSARTKDNLKLKLATGEMMSRLNVLAKASGSSLLDKLQPSLLPESDRGVWIQGANKAFWQASLARSGVAA
ncbi:hypothetical protein JCM8547_008890 [Rhodosporidiobolus lusitaniae]